MVRNEYNIGIREICASCAYREFRNEDMRLCSLTGEVKKPTDNCDKHVLRVKFGNAGRGDGRVRSLRNLITHIRDIQGDKKGYWTNRLKEIDENA